MKTIYFSSFNLKLIAITTMAVDHVGLLFFPEQPLFRLVGRLSFPLFAFLIAEGFEKTSSVEKYFWRLLSFAAISQLPYSLFKLSAGYSPETLNIFFTLAAGLFALTLCKRLPFVCSFPGVLLLLLLSSYFPFDYGAYGILTVLASGVFLKFRRAGSTFLLLLPLLDTLAILFSGILSLQIYASLSVPFLLGYNGERGRQFSRKLFYWFYPAHLLLLWCIWYALTRIRP